jgi:hypothetical protein
VLNAKNNIAVVVDANAVVYAIHSSTLVSAV